MTFVLTRTELPFVGEINELLGRKIQAIISWSLLGAPVYLALARKMLDVLFFFLRLFDICRGYDSVIDLKHYPAPYSNPNHPYKPPNPNPHVWGTVDQPKCSHFPNVPTLLVECVSWYATHGKYKHTRTHPRVYFSGCLTLSMFVPGVIEPLRLKLISPHV